MTLENKNIIYFSPLNWNDNWQRQQEFASRMAQKNQVLYISPIGSFNFGLLGILKKLFGQLKIRRGKQREIRNEAPKNIHFATLFFIPRHNNKFFERINTWLLVSQLRKHLKQHHMTDNYIFWTGNPVRTVSNLIGKFQPKAAVYDNAMRFEKLKDASDYILQHEKELVQKCDFVVCDNEFKKKVYESWGAKVYKIPQAVNLLQFDRNKTHTKPKNLEGIAQPIVGYYGVLRDVIDFALLQYVVKKLPHTNFVFMGNVWENLQVDELNKNPNVHVLPAVQHSDLPSYLAHFDVTIIPYLVNEYTQGTFPNKLFEYFSFLKPVVAETLPEFELYKDYMYLTNDKDIFARFIEEALQNGAKNKEGLPELVLQNTWEARYQALEKAFEEQHA